MALAGVSTDSLDSHRAWARRLRLPYPLLSDPERMAGEAFGLIRRIGVGDWKIELFRRTTVLVDAAGVVRRVWGKVRVRGHAAEVLAAARESGSAGPDPAGEMRA